MLRTALIVEATESEETLAPWRARLDPQAARGVPAHITVLFPFLALENIDAHVNDLITTVALGVRAFDYMLTEPGWFDGTAPVLWIAPEPRDAFLHLTGAFVEAFPDHLPYRGAHDEVVPHVTTGEGRLSDLRAAEAAILPALPLRGHAAAVTLLVEQPDRSWRRHRQYPLYRS